MLDEKATKAVNNEEERAFGLVRAAVRDSIGKGLVVPAKPFSTGVLPQAHDIRVIPIDNDSC